MNFWEYKAMNTEKLLMIGGGIVAAYLLYTMFFASQSITTSQG